jgi:outer membrane lipoprotein-sorting protein
MSIFRRLAATVALLAVAAVSGAGPGVAAGATAAPRLSAQDMADIARVEEYLDGVRTLKSRFIQITGGRQATGTFYLSRPGRMRLEYDPPAKDFVVADGVSLVYWDGEMNQQSDAPIGSTLADFILRKDLKLSGDIGVTGVARGPGAIEIGLTETKDAGKGTLTLVFEDRPLRLRKWRVLDAQGTTTEVALLNPQFGVALERGLFVFHDPRGEHSSAR